jgi:predicted GIY-YIG superfamily endonuclease
MLNNFYFVYILQSINFPDRFYSGYTVDLQRRLDEHNQGKSIHTNKYRPWKIRDYFAFDDERRAKDFEKYLKTASGRAFQKKRL